MTTFDDPEASIRRAVELEAEADAQATAGDDATAERRYREALASIHGLLLHLLTDPAPGSAPDRDLISSTTEVSTRLRSKLAAYDSPPPTPQEVADRLRAETEEAMAAGDIAHASHLCFRLGDHLVERADRAGAESAYRRAVVLARQVDAEDPELVLTAFTSLSEFLAPSQESVALAEELVEMIVERREMYHPMRAAEATASLAWALLRMADLDPARASEGVERAEQAVEHFHGCCLHGEAQDMQQLTARALRAVGRHEDAARWQAEVDRYAHCTDWDDWEVEVIPGHVHLWDIRLTKPWHRAE